MKHDESMPRGNAPPGTVDWDKVRSRLEEVHARIDQAWAPAPDDTLHILKARARMLAREGAPTVSADKCIEVVEFVLAHEQYAIESRFVRDVCPLDHLTQVPCTPGFVLGIVNLRGEILSVIDVRKFFDLPEKGLTDLNKIIVLDDGEMCFGVLADSIVGVHAIDADDIQASLPTLTGIRGEYLKGVTSDRKVILDAGRLLSDKSIVVNEQVGG